MGYSTCPWHYCPREIVGVLMAVNEHGLIVFMSFMTLFCHDLVAVILTIALLMSDTKLSFATFISFIDAFNFLQIPQRRLSHWCCQMPVSPSLSCLSSLLLFSFGFHFYSRVSQDLDLLF
ncbi:hypothetical protein DER46DRAFT_255142 [Fusarium sp. MPI-SDFR-AT-0072]|nr:hypothetical protein DER46DRAFT_255142 [Fusarium sp. MPI-SDFR-AT-0072]